MGTVLGLDCNSLLISFWEWLLVLWLLLDPFTNCGNVVYSHTQDTYLLCLGPLIMSLRLEEVWSLWHRSATLGALPCKVSMDGMSMPASAPGGYFLENQEHLSSSWVWGSCATLRQSVTLCSIFNSADGWISLIFLSVILSTTVHIRDCMCNVNERCFAENLLWSYPKGTY